MKTLMLPLLVLALAGPGAADEKVALEGGQKTYTVEVVSADTSARTLTVRSGAGTSTLRVDQGALDGLRDVKPGDKITITLRDEATGRRQMVSAVVSGTISGTPGAVAPSGEAPVSVRAERTVVLKQAGTAVELLSLDPATRRLVVVGDGGAKQVLNVDEKTLLSLADVKPGQRLFVSYRFDRDGKPEAVVRVGAARVTTTITTTTPTASAPTAPSVTLEGGTVEVVSTDPLTRRLKIRTEAGDQRTLVVDDMALVDLQALKPGDTALLTLEGDRVLVITRKE
jgi:uncharacterized protein YndB with AHSA1/START domain